MTPEEEELIGKELFNQAPTKFGMAVMPTDQTNKGMTTYFAEGKIGTLAQILAHTMTLDKTIKSMVLTALMIAEDEIHPSESHDCAERIIQELTFEEIQSKILLNLNKSNPNVN